jgi:hypothetical protein
MQPRPLILLGAACALALGCATNTPIYHERSIELNSAGNDPWEPGGTRDRIVGALEARGYAVQHLNLRAPRVGYDDYAGLRAPWGIRIRPDGWDQIDVLRVSGSNQEQQPPRSYRWVVRARTFAADGVERSTSAQAQADVDSVMAELNTVAEPSRGAATRTGSEYDLDNVWIGAQGTCYGGQQLGAFVALPPWAGASTKGTNADRIAATLAAAGWTVARRLPVASLGMLVAERPQPTGSDGLTVFAIRAEDPSGNGIRIWYEVRAASCDSAGRRAPPRPAARPDADHLVTALQHVLAVGP